ncbi:hypothetical protein JB92DRAFT_2826174 [Gautieria morchelliformis]|nr:hypothetical protein JB92DRAFT_2826174 [Gautieria morchelliformis]
MFPPDDLSESSQIGKGKSATAEQLTSPGGCGSGSAAAWCPRSELPRNIGSAGDSGGRAQAAPSAACASRHSLRFPVRILQARAGALYPHRAGSTREALSINVSLPSIRPTPPRSPPLPSQAPQTQLLGVFTGIIVIVSVGSLAVTVQAKVIGSIYDNVTHWRVWTAIVNGSNDRASHPKASGLRASRGHVTRKIRLLGKTKVAPNHSKTM